MVRKPLVENIISCEYEGAKYAVKTVRWGNSQGGQPVRILGKIERELGMNYDAEVNGEGSLIRYRQGSMNGQFIFVTPVNSEVEDKILEGLVRRTVH